MHERVLKLQAHFNQANEDMRQIVISAEKVEKRGARITEVEFDGRRRRLVTSLRLRCPQDWKRANSRALAAGAKSASGPI